ncbi:MAG: hypothetical protein WBO45_15750 [Planctomycetota bacterium]
MLFAGLAGSVSAQVPEQFPWRRVHRCIADPVPGAWLNGTAPVFQYEDGEWNHGEGFRPGTTGPDADWGGWFNEDDGTYLTALDIHTNRQDAFVDINPWSTIV